MADYETVIGLEVHVELATRSKIFCGCSTAFGAKPNTQVCPVCLGLPGVLPVLNRQAVDYALRAALALNCRIPAVCKFDRKNYFYPDLPKNFQITQYDMSIAYDGYIELGDRRVGIERMNLEEEAGKSLHEGSDITTAAYSLEDYNRTGIPLLEIVSKPDIRTPEEARAFLERLRSVIQFVEISDCKMEEGSLRCDANISVRPRGGTGLSAHTELKNLNSFRAVQRALAYEAARQCGVLEEGGAVTRETRHWDEARGVTVAMRSKEQAHDYRYFPEPDLPPVVIDAAWIERVRATLPELPEARRLRYVRDYGLSDYDASLVTETKASADYFEECVRLGADPKAVANWMMGELTRLMNASGLDVVQARARVSPASLVRMIQLLRDGTISGKIAKAVLEEMFASGRSPEAVVAERGLVQVSDESELAAAVDNAVAQNPTVVADFLAGKEKALAFLVGQVMRATSGKANPQLVNRMLRDRLSREV